MTTLARLVAAVREAANQRLWETLYGLLSAGQRAVLDSLLTVPPGARVSELDRLRRGPVRISGPHREREDFDVPPLIFSTGVRYFRGATPRRRGSP